MPSLCIGVAPVAAPGCVMTISQADTHLVYNGSRRTQKDSRRAVLDTTLTAGRAWPITLAMPMKPPDYCSCRIRGTDADVAASRAVLRRPRDVEVPDMAHAMQATQISEKPLHLLLVFLEATLATGRAWVHDLGDAHAASCLLQLPYPRYRRRCSLKPSRHEGPATLR